jgi:hypothetical protein
MPLVIHPELVFSEMDKFEVSVGDTHFNKTDYYLIQDFSKDKMKMKSLLDSFVNTHPEFKTPGFGNYLVFFYLRNKNLNEKVINEEKPEL